MRLRATLAIAMALAIFLTGQKASLGNEPQREADTYLLTSLSNFYDERFLIKNIAIKHTKTGKRSKIGIKEHTRYTLKKVDPGDYYVSDIYSRYRDVPPTRYPQPDKLFRLVPGALNYIGDLVTRTEEHGTKWSTSFWFQPVRETVELAVKNEAEEIGNLPIFMILPGETPIQVVIDEGSVENGS